jgi:hypothetical protein
MHSCLTFHVMFMVDFQTLVLVSLSFLTAAMFVFYYLVVIKPRRQLDLTSKILHLPQPFSQTPPLPQATLPALRGESAVRALEDFAEDLERAEGEDSSEIHRASLIKLAKVLINVIRANGTSAGAIAHPSEGRRVVRQRKKQATESTRKHRNSLRYGRTATSHEPCKRGRKNLTNRTKEAPATRHTKS